MDNVPHFRLVDNFVTGKIGLLVTKDEYREFIAFCQDNFTFHTTDKQYLDGPPDPMASGYACVFYRYPKGGSSPLMYWRCFSLDKLPKDLPFVVFSLMKGDPKQHYQDAKIALNGVKITIEAAALRMAVVESHLNALGKMLGYE